MEVESAATFTFMDRTYTLPVYEGDPSRTIVYGPWRPGGRKTFVRKQNESSKEFVDKVLKSAAAAEAAAMQAANFPEESFVSPSSSPLRRAGKSHSAVNKRELEKVSPDVNKEQTVERESSGKPAARRGRKKGSPEVSVTSSYKPYVDKAKEFPSLPTRAAPPTYGLSQRNEKLMVSVRNLILSVQPPPP